MNLQTTQKLSLDFNQKSYKTLNASQYDKESRYVVIQCTDQGKFVPLDETVYANARSLTADGRALLDSTTVQEDGTLFLELDDTLLAAPGKATVQLDLYQENTNQRLTTMKFFVNVESAVYEDDTIIASDEFHALTDLMGKALDTYDSVIAETQKITDKAEGFSEDAQGYAQESANSARDSAISAQAAASSAGDSANFAQAAANSTEESANSAQAAANSALGAQGFANDAADKVVEAEGKVTEAAEKVLEAANFAEVSKGHAEISKEHANTSNDHALLSKSYAMGDTGKRENENLENAKYYYEQAKCISESFAGTLRPKGTITFENLPSATDAKEGDMYNVSDQFTTTASFKEGAGNVIPAGSNVYRTDDGFWDVLAGSPVTGVKGDTEASYRRGNVNITAEDIGLGNVTKNITDLQNKMNAIEAVWEHVLWDTSGWNPFTETAPIVNEEVAQDEN